MSSGLHSVSRRQTPPEPEPDEIGLECPECEEIDWRSYVSGYYSQDRYIYGNSAYGEYGDTDYEPNDTGPWECNGCGHTADGALYDLLEETM